MLETNITGDNPKLGDFISPEACLTVHPVTQLGDLKIHGKTLQRCSQIQW